MTDRYVDATLGSDSDPGTIGEPWQTLDKLRTAMAVGDTAYLKRGETWVERIRVTLVTPASESDRMTFDAYGTGARPVVAPGSDATVSITSIAAYEVPTAERTRITASAGGFTGSANKFLHFVTDDICGTIKAVISDTVVEVNGDFSAATSTQSGGIYSLNAIDISNRSYMTFQNLRFTDAIGCNIGSGTAVKFLNNGVDNIYNGSAGYVVECNGTDAATLIHGNSITSCPATIAAIGGTSVTNITVSNNTVDNVDGDGIKFPTANTITVEGNTVGNGRLGEIGSQGHQDGIVCGPIWTDCIVRNNTVYDMTQLIYSPVKDDASGALTGCRFYGNVGYITSGYAGGTSPFIFFDGRLDTAEISDVDVFSNTCGDLGGDITPILINGNAAGTYSDINIRNNAAFTDGTVTATIVDDDANTASAIDSDYNAYGGFGDYSEDGGNSIALSASPFVNYSGENAVIFNLHHDTDSDLTEAGDPSLTSNVDVPATFLDRDGKQRVKDGGDIGAYKAWTSQAASGNLPPDGYPDSAFLVSRSRGAHPAMTGNCES